MRSLSIILILMICLLGCSSEQTNKHNSYESLGEYWKVKFDDTSLKRNGKDYFQIHYIYIGSINDLQEIERITFAQGTKLGTQLVNLYDPNYKEQLILKGNYAEEYEEKYGIKIEKIKERNSREFIIEYNNMQVDSGYTTLDAINEDGINIQIGWESKDKKYNDELNIRGSQ